MRKSRRSSHSTNVTGGHSLTFPASPKTIAEKGDFDGQSYNVILHYNSERFRNNSNHLNINSRLRKRSHSFETSGGTSNGLGDRNHHSSAKFGKFETDNHRTNIKGENPVVNNNNHNNNKGAKLRLSDNIDATLYPFSSKYKDTPSAENHPVMCLQNMRNYKITGPLSNLINGDTLLKENIPEPVSNREVMSHERSTLIAMKDENWKEDSDVVVDHLLKYKSLWKLLESRKKELKKSQQAVTRKNFTTSGFSSELNDNDNTAESGTST
ncbi:hypothetical protein PACTADRAFT_50686 [Pachysolen tannophilus NRRL Y-2460]|uniref:Uncharacterized protein n=1 Tax=Pachysolen tannophilus NRRL Y-2460 TaxID=669874 RepID=A0A1E4TT25_PACTA|nr:hypothetical protein PACTADRAFT_50686 [Pachysolen tannophilus NRRL Y-2460]